jgi:hypothetical protein
MEQNNEPIFFSIDDAEVFVTNHCLDEYPDKFINELPEILFREYDAVFHGNIHWFIYNRYCEGL